MKKLLCVLMALSAVQFSLSAQNRVTGEVKITQNRFELSDGRVYIDMDIDITGVNVYRNEAIGILPVIRTDAREMELPEVLINGKNKSKQFRRTEAMAPEMLTGENFHTVVNLDRDYNGKINYQTVVPYESWMETSTLSLQEDLFGCAGDVQFLEIRMMNALKLPEPEPVPPPVIVNVEERDEKVYQLEADAYLEFVVAKYDIRRDLGRNAYEIDKVQKLIDSVRNDEYYEIKAIHVTGYASPEGGYDYNMNLSKNRANSFREYLQQRNPNIPANAWHVDWKGEDWEGLVNMVKNSDMQYRDEVLQIIESTSDMAQRDTKIKNLRGGAPYNYMLQNYYPRLRRVNVRIDYQFKKVTVETKQVIQQP